MNKRKLPKAVTRTADDMRRAGAMLEPEGTVSRLKPVQCDGPRAIATDAGGRLSRANAIVERYANFSALGGVIPLPLINVAGLTVINLRMVKILCGLYDVPYEPGRARALVVGLAAGAVPTTASAVTTSTLVFFMPGVNLLGLAVSSVTASACTRAVGRRFVAHLENGATLMDFPVVNRG